MWSIKIPRFNHEVSVVRRFHFLIFIIMEIFENYSFFWKRLPDYAALYKLTDISITYPTLPPSSFILIVFDILSLNSTALVIFLTNTAICKWDYRQTKPFFLPCTHPECRSCKIRTPGTKFSRSPNGNGTATKIRTAHHTERRWTRPTINIWKSEKARLYPKTLSRMKEEGKSNVQFDTLLTNRH